MAATHYVAFVETPDAFSAAPLPLGKSLPFGWPAFAVRRGIPVVLSWRVTPGRPERFRLTFALAEREHKILEMTSVATGEVIGVFEVHSPQYLQTIEVFLESKDLSLQDGVALKVVRGADPAWFFGIPRGQKAPPALLPPLLPHALENDDFSSNDPLAEFYPRLQSMASLQPFGWKAGAVYEGLWALSRLPGGGKARSVLNAQLGLFLSPGGHLKYLAPTNHPVQDDPHGLEALYPLSILAQIDPHHPAVNAALFWLGRRPETQELHLRDALYTAPFAAAVAAGRGNDTIGREWADWAFAQLAYRRSELVAGGDGPVWGQRHADSRLTGENKLRSLASYALGVARTLESLPAHEQAAEWKAEAIRLATSLQQQQRADGLWGGTYDPAGNPDLFSEPELGASALCALFLVTGMRCGWLPPETRSSAARAAVALREHLTPDGYLIASASETPPPPLSAVPRGGFPASAFGEGEFEMPPAPAPYPTGELAPWAMGWLGATLAALA